uniref:Uncharacterized LOC114458429 n=2 Tax=Gouania willdenowi TaxID=441366 RepID=A0A8C5HBY8_GOUWI
MEDEDGTRLNCSSSSVNNCKVTALPCGKTYNVTVSYSDGTCLSSSQPISMDSVPCGPEAVDTSVLCLTNDLLVWWNVSRRPAESYRVEVSRGLGQTLYCNSSSERNSSCRVEGLQCGASYSVLVFSVTGSCSSRPSTEVTVQSSPCPPSSITASYQCAPGPSPVSWSPSAGAQSYTAVAESDTGHMVQCTSTSSTSCSLSGLLCGQTYSVGVSATDDTCTSPLNNTVSLSTEPCSPSDLLSLLSCSEGSAQVFWVLSSTAVNYHVTAVSDVESVSCSSSSTSCSLSDLLCGQEYHITVTATDGTCVSNASQPLRQHPVPCAPHNVTHELDCRTGELTVRWNSSSSAALNYSVTAVPLVGNTGSGPVVCVTDESSCALTDLQCGQTYNVSVQGFSGSCVGPTSPTLEVHTAPCWPQSVTSVSDCDSDSPGVLVSWFPSPGASSFTATVTGADGASQSCSTPSTSCSFSDLQCFTEYNVTVTAQRQDTHCSSSASTASFTTGPCDPTNVSSVLHCGSDSATVSWFSAGGNESYTYTVLAQEDSGHLTSCRSSNTSCEMDELRCGTVYNVTVTADDGSCNSSGGGGARLWTAPCAPPINHNSLICGNGSSAVFWTPVAEATGYLVSATAESGHSVSCSSDGHTCVLEDLLCSDTYNASVTALGRECDSSPGPAFTFSTAPCAPSITFHHYDCDSNSVQLRWAEPDGHVDFLAVLYGDGYHDNCRTGGTNCSFPNVPCGQNVTVGVQAQGAECNSTTTHQLLHTAPCPPSNVSANQLCSNHPVVVTWEGSPDASGYNVTVRVGGGDHTRHCFSNGSSCEVPDILCGQTYSVFVTASSEACEGNPSEELSFSSGPCAPSNISVSSSCEDSSVSWSHVPGAHAYVATAIADDGHVHMCSSNSSNSCVFTELSCGQTYVVTVVTVDGECYSDPSSAEQLETPHCPPSNLTGHMTCNNNTLTLSWTPVPGASYVLQMSVMGDTSPTSELTSSLSTLTLSDLQCGHTYGFKVAAREGTCLSSYSPPFEITTAPCPPSNFTARMDCGTNNGNFSWVESSEASGEGVYLVEVTGEHGLVTSCSSNHTSCAVKLLCGRSYSASLVTSTPSCNSSAHTSISFTSAPCLPAEVSAELLCDSNVMNVNWNQSQSSGSDQYTAWAISGDGHRVSCNSTSTHCSIHQLLCGRVYQVVVTSSSIHCQLIAGSDYMVHSAPCRPENVTVEQNCSSKAVDVSWSSISSISLTQNYTVTARSTTGLNSSCESEEDRCSFSELSCGQLYTFTVIGRIHECVSNVSNAVEMLTAPCPPTNVSAELDCTSHVAVVRWSNAAATTRYSAWATSSNGHNTSCSSTGALCSLSGMRCGQEYSVVVEASDTGCPGPDSASITLTTEPCVPVNVSVLYSEGSALVLWSPGGGASSYSVLAESQQGLELTCNSTSNTSCSLIGLQCGHAYNVTVTAHNEACDSVASQHARLLTEPCPPTNVQASLACDQRSVIVSWESSELAVGYVTYIQNQNAAPISLESRTTSCVSSALTCGIVYQVWVKAMGERENSSDSTTLALTAAPCEPINISSIMDCEGSRVVVQWEPSLGAWSYVTVLTASSGHMVSCSSNHTHCELSALRCGRDYNVTVTAVGDTCNSSALMEGVLYTEPCAPDSLSVQYEVGVAQVTWAVADGAASYSVQAVTDRGLTSSCNASDGRCSLIGLMCGQTYNVTVATGNQACNSSHTSQPYSLNTEPCPPANVQASVACEQLSSNVSWEQSLLAVGYITYFDDQNGHNTSFESSDTWCVTSELLCGSVYSVWVKALGEIHNSSHSVTLSLTTAPCLPSNMAVNVNCDSDQDAVVSWTSFSSSAAAVNVSATSEVGGALQCVSTSQQSNCNLTSLSCGRSYELSLSVSNEQCSLTAPTRLNLTTRPCAPQGVSVDLQCGSQDAVLSWTQSSEVEVYRGRVIKASGGGAMTCNSTTSSCDFTELDCGQIYNFTVSAEAGGCLSTPSDTVFIHTGPCQPIIVSAQTSCQRDDLLLSWQPLISVESYVVNASGSLGFLLTLNTTRTELNVTLPCGQDYRLTVQGVARLCHSPPSAPVLLRTAPCEPMGVETLVQCEADTGSVRWGPSDGAESYVAIATSLSGHAHQCETNLTWCSWSDLHCGEEYLVRVRAKNQNCTSRPSNTSLIHMAPCAPQSVSASVDCESESVSVSWNVSGGMNVFTVSAESGDMFISTTSPNTSVTFTNLTCGQIYNMWVTADSQHCSSDQRTSTLVHTWPCSPVGISTSQDCVSGIAMVTWEPSNGSDYYTVTMETETGWSEMCMSDNGTCSVPDLTCGQNFSVSLTASNQQCNVTSNQTSILHTAPCVPIDVAVVTDCATNKATVSWSSSQGAPAYRVTARCSHGNNDSCQTSDLSCDLGSLMCGATYTVQVVAVDNASCSSSPSEDVQFDSGPCPPLNVSAEVNCTSADISVSWDSVGDTERFIVFLSSHDAGISQSCNTSERACDFTNVACGNVLSASVTSVRGHCNSTATPSSSVQSVPCTPRGVRGVLDCVTNSAWISWDAAGDAQNNYSVLATGEGGGASSCNTASNSTCEVEQLDCGVLYAFTVTASNSQCESTPSNAIQLHTAPCSLGSISVIPQCRNSSILVLWDQMEASEGSALYTATAEGSDHTYLSCNGSASSCYLLGAQCGLRYTVIVSASSDVCSGMRSPPQRVTMEPCPPSDVTVGVSCSEGGALVSWNGSAAAESYHVVASSADGHQRVCNTSSTSCSLTGLRCETQYVALVTAIHDNCTSETSQSQPFYTVPCEPSGVSVTFHCGNMSTVLSWFPNTNAMGYYACATEADGVDDGDALCCYSANTSCSLVGVACGSVYNVSVRASDGTCNGSYSETVQGAAVPCPPDAVQVQLIEIQRDLQVMSFTWNQSSCELVQYLLRLTGTLEGDSHAHFDLSSYWTEAPYFEMPLPCGSAYNATMRSRNAAGTSGESHTLTGITAPCPPASVFYNVNASFTTVSWDSAAFAVSYTVYDTGVSPRVQLCNTQRLSCSLTNVTWSHLMVTASNQEGESHAANATHAAQGRRRRDVNDQREINAPEVTLSAVTDTLVSIEWSPVAGSSSYSASMKKQDGGGDVSGDQELTVFGESVFFTDLSPASYYCFSVHAVYSEDIGPESEPLCVRTRPLTNV